MDGLSQKDRPSALFNFPKVVEPNISGGPQTCPQGVAENHHPQKFDFFPCLHP
jgi:hypothetical protein